MLTSDWHIAEVEIIYDFSVFYFFPLNCTYFLKFGIRNVKGLLLFAV